MKRASSHWELTSLARIKMQKFTGISFDSRTVEKGYLFVAVKGLTVDGHNFINNAIKKGAVAVIGERDKSQLDIPNGFEYIKVKDSKEALGEYASRFYGEPSKKLKIIGVTGTKGKTTTAHLIHHILTTCGKKVGLISSITSPGFHVTSLDVISLHKTLSEMISEGKEYAVIEVSSHGIDQKRIAGVKFDVTVLTNIAPEHLDYHKTLKEYKRVKMSFVNSGKFKIIAPLTTDIKILPGLYNNLNVEAAVSAITKFGIPRSQALDAVKSFALPEGRLSEIPTGQGFRVFIDFAHTPDSLAAVLTHLKSETKGRLISVFGCAGERDPRKRSKMGKISGELADISVFTAEDPRSENLFKILGKMASGARRAEGREGETFFRISERGEAIAFAISHAKSGDVIGARS